MPSGSKSVFLAVSVWPWIGLPVIATPPVGGSLMLATTAEVAEVTDSVVPGESVYDATTVITLPTSDWVSI